MYCLRGVVLLWSSRDMHSGAARCTLGHVTHFASRKTADIWLGYQIPCF
jgi:hypothetical protein